MRMDVRIWREAGIVNSAQELLKDNVCDTKRDGTSSGIRSFHDSELWEKLLPSRYLLMPHDAPLVGEVAEGAKLMRLLPIKVPSSTPKASTLLTSNRRPTMRSIEKRNPGRIKL
jgi:hypothetical protein